MIYADYNATTPIGEAAKKEIEQAFTLWGNPSSAHGIGRKANAALEGWREAVAKAAGVKPTDVVFTSGGSEANGMVLMGSALQRPSDFRLLTSPVEHASVNTALPLLCDKLKATVETVTLDPRGGLDFDAFKAQLEKFKPHLVSLMAANNETGILFPVKEVAALCQEKGIPFHSDATQAFGKVPIEFFNEADFFTLSGHKIYGPKGVGALVVRRGHKLEVTRFGGSQEIKRRGGTQNMIGIAGFAGACMDLGSKEDVTRIRELRDSFERRLREELEDVIIHGEGTERLPNTTCVRFKGLSSEILLSAVDLDGFCASGGSACSSGSVSPSHVLSALGLTPEEAREAIRISWGRHTTKEEIQNSVELIVRHVRRIRDRRAKRKA